MVYSKTLSVARTTQRLIVGLANNEPERIKKGTGCGLISGSSPTLDCREENHEIFPRVLGFRTKTTLLKRRRGLDDAQEEAVLTI